MPPWAKRCGRRPRRGWWPHCLLMVSIRTNRRQGGRATAATWTPRAASLRSFPRAEAAADRLLQQSHRRCARSSAIVRARGAALAGSFGVITAVPAEGRWTAKGSIRAFRQNAESGAMPAARAALAHCLARGCAECACVRAGCVCRTASLSCALRLLWRAHTRVTSSHA